MDSPPSPLLQLFYLGEGRGGLGGRNYLKTTGNNKMEMPAISV